MIFEAFFLRWPFYNACRITESEAKTNIEDGPYGGNGGNGFTDGGEVHLNGPITSFRQVGNCYCWTFNFYSTILL